MPGNADERYEAAFAKEKENWKMPLDKWQRDVIRDIFWLAFDGGGA